jgi:transcriptional regulator with XRE-family HTH domain
MNPISADTAIDTPTSFGARLTEERQRLGLAVHELAHLAGITDYLQKRFENGTSVIPIDYLQALAVRTDADLQFLVTGRQRAS